MPSEFKDRSGHVVTTNLDVVEDDVLREAMKMGTTYRNNYVPGGGDDVELIKNF